MDILTDYAAIAVGTAQAATGKVLTLGRAGVSRVAGLRLPGGPAGDPNRAGIEAGDLLRQGRDLVVDLAGDVRGMVGRLIGRP